MHLDKQVAQNAFDLENQMNMFFKLLISHFEYMQFYYTQATQVFFFFFNLGEIVILLIVRQ
jgi:hypothetical protein